MRAYRQAIPRARYRNRAISAPPCRALGFLCAVMLAFTAGCMDTSPPETPPPPPPAAPPKTDSAASNVVTELVSQLRFLRQVNGRFAEQMDDLQMETEDRDKIIVKLKAALDDAQTRLSELTSEVAQLNEQIAENDELIAKARLFSEEMKKYVADRKRDSSALRQQLDEALATIADLRDARGRDGGDNARLSDDGTPHKMKGLAGPTPIGKNRGKPPREILRIGQQNRE